MRKAKAMRKAAAQKLSVSLRQPGAATGKQLETVVSPKSKLTRPIKKPKATWVEPMFFADVEYRDITSEGLLRQSSFKGLKKK
jgi:ATP-dependent DNA ligase